MEDSSASALIKNKAIRSVKWSALMEVVTRAVNPIVNVILARVLAPDDFGVIAIAVIAIELSQILWDAGLSQTLIQTNDAPEEAAHVVFWTNMFLGVLIYTILIFVAPSIAVFFNSPTVQPVLRILGIQILLGAFSSVQQGLFLRDLDFRHLFWIQLLMAIIPAFFSLSMAFLGYGVWALVVGTLIKQITNLVFLWLYSPWRPKFYYDFKLARNLFKFSIWVLIESLEYWLITWGDHILVGKFLDVGELGVYQMGRTITVSLITLVLNPFTPLLYPTFSRLQNDLATLKESFHKVNRIIISLVLPIGLGLLITGPEIASVFFGNKWQDLGLVLSLIGLMGGLSWLVGINPVLYRAVGRPDLNVNMFFITAIISIPAYYFAIQFGLVVFLIVRLCVVFIEVALKIFQFKQTMRDSLLYIWHDGKSFFISTLILGIILLGIKWSLYSIIPDITQVFVLGILVILGVPIYLSAVWLIDKPFVSQIFRLIKKAV